MTNYRANKGRIKRKVHRIRIKKEDGKGCTRREDDEEEGSARYVVDVVLVLPKK